MYPTLWTSDSTFNYKYKIKQIINIQIINILYIYIYNKKATKTDFSFTENHVVWFKKTQAAAIPSLQCSSAKSSPLQQCQNASSKWHTACSWMTWQLMCNTCTWENRSSWNLGLVPLHGKRCPTVMRKWDTVMCKSLFFTYCRDVLLLITRPGANKEATDASTLFAQGLLFSNSTLWSTNPVWLHLLKISKVQTILNSQSMKYWPSLWPWAWM